MAFSITVEPSSASRSKRVPSKATMVSCVIDLASGHHDWRVPPSNNSKVQSTHGTPQTRALADDRSILSACETEYAVLGLDDGGGCRSQCRRVTGIGFA